jgi:hypothetical protein
MSRERELGLEGQAELLHESRRTRSRSRLSRDVIRERGALRSVPPEREEHLLAQLVGISADQTRMWPEIVRLLEDAERRDWSRPMLLVPPDGDAGKLKVRTFGSFEVVYAELVEPWLGSWAELQKTYARFKAGEIDQEQGAEEILRRRGRPKKGHEKGCDHNVKRGTAKHWKLRLAREAPDDPEAAVLLESVERGELSANAAAVAKGWRKPRDPYHQLVLWWDHASPKDRACFHTYLKAWAEKEDA